MSKNLKVGDTAPSFSLLGHDGKIYTLEAALKHGPVIIVFYPFDQSPNCTRRLCSINVLRDQYNSEGITVFGINNAQEESHKDFVLKAELTMPLLSDTDFSVARSYNALFVIGPIKVIRNTLVVIDTNGEIILHTHGRLPDSKKMISFIRSYSTAKKLA